MLRDLAYRVEEDAEQIRYLDVTYARVAGFRPLLLDLFVPRSTTPVAGGDLYPRRRIPGWQPPRLAGIRSGADGARLCGGVPANSAQRASTRAGSAPGGVRQGAMSLRCSPARRVTPNSTVRSELPAPTAVSWYGPMNLATQPRLGPAVLHITDPARSPESLLLGAAVGRCVC